MHCTHCGNTIELNDLFCGECGKKIEAHQNIDQRPTNMSSSISQTTAEQSNSHHSTEQSKHTFHQKTHFSKHSTEIFSETKQFFKQAFTNPDQSLNSKHQFSFKTIFSLIIIGFIILALLLSILVPEEVALLTTSKSSVVFNISFYALIAMAVLFGTSLILFKLVNIKLSVHKVLSDFLLVNTFSSIFLMLGLLFLIIKVPSFGMMLIIISFLFSLISPIYLLTIHSHMQQLRMPIVYAILLYILILGIITRIFIEGTVSNYISSFESLFNSTY
ncbi:zinc ribbon domain-containing protein [Staphylococcus casei]|uniref:Zinc ribbon domain-containing protein n=1 Tax=Staphylococcus casei TaxID=201828 RepID=A0ABZ2W8B1_9STAP